MPRHGMLTWKDLLARLQEMNAEELEQTATVQTTVLEEFYGVTGFGVCKDGDAADGILDEGHLYMEVDV